MGGLLRLAMGRMVCRAVAEGDGEHRSTFRSDDVSNGTSCGAERRQAMRFHPSPERATYDLFFASARVEGVRLVLRFRAAFPELDGPVPGGARQSRRIGREGNRTNPARMSL